MHGEMVLPHQVNSCWTWTAGTVYSSWMTNRGCRQQRDKAGGASMAAEILAAPLIHPPRVLQAKALNHTHVAVLCQLMTPCRWILVGSSVGRRSIWRLWILNIERPSLLFDLQLLRIQPFRYLSYGFFFSIHITTVGTSYATTNTPNINYLYIYICDEKKKLGRSVSVVRVRRVDVARTCHVRRLCNWVWSIPK